jgi:hypothetical protein
MVFQADPGDEPKAGVEMKAMPEGGGEGETKEIDKEEGK